MAAQPSGNHLPGLDVTENTKCHKYPLLRGYISSLWKMILPRHVKTSNNVCEPMTAQPRGNHLHGLDVTENTKKCHKYPLLRGYISSLWKMLNVL